MVLIKLLANIFSLPFRLMAIFLPVDKKVWLFGAWKGARYSDNSRALFEYINNHQPSTTKCVWISKKASVISEIRSKGYSAYSFYSIKGIYYALVAGVVVTCVGFTDTGLFAILFPWKKRFVQLWHGTPLKKLENMKIFSLYEQIITTAILGYVGRWFDYIFSAADCNKPIYASVFEVDESVVKVAGQPRNDALFADRTANASRKIIYMPTWREYDLSYDLFYQHGFDVEQVNRSLERMNAELYIKFHVNESMKDAFSGKGSRVHILDTDDVYQVLSSMDVMITDYSSVYFDYLLLDKPIVFTPFDLETYTERRGFYHQYNDVTPGPKSRNWKDALEQVAAALSGADGYGEARKLVSQTFNKWPDAGSSERVFLEICRLTR